MSFTVKAVKYNKDGKLLRMIMSEDLSRFEADVFYKGWTQSGKYSAVNIFDESGNLVSLAKPRLD